MIGRLAIELHPSGGDSIIGPAHCGEVKFNTVETGYKVTSYKVKSDIKLSFYSPKVPF